MLGATPIVGFRGPDGGDNNRQGMSSDDDEFVCGGGKQPESHIGWKRNLKRSANKSGEFVGNEYGQHKAGSTDDGQQDIRGGVDGSSDEACDDFMRGDDQPEIHICLESKGLAKLNYNEEHGGDEYEQDEGGSSVGGQHDHRGGVGDVEDKCPICLGSLSIIGAMACWSCTQVMGHEDCVLPWLSNNNSCPCCRALDPSPCTIIPGQPQYLVSAGNGSREE
jgi:hypothetical protein